jgi:hypothetical protein
MLQLLTQMVFFWEIHVFLHLRWVALSGDNKPMSILISLPCRKYSLKN